MQSEAAETVHPSPVKGLKSWAERPKTPPPRKDMQRKWGGDKWSPKAAQGPACTWTLGPAWGCLELPPLCEVAQ